VNRLKPSHIIQVFFHVGALVILIGCISFQLDFKTKNIPADSDGQAIIGVGMFFIFTLIALIIGFISALILGFQIFLKNRMGLIYQVALIIYLILIAIVIYLYGK